MPPLPRLPFQRLSLQAANERENFRSPVEIIRATSAHTGSPVPCSVSQTDLSSVKGFQSILVEMWNIEAVKIHDLHFRVIITALA